MARLPAGLTIRTYEPRDHDAVWRLHLEGVRRGPHDLPVPSHFDDDLRDVESSYLGEASCFWVADSPDGLVGMTAIQRIDAETGRLRRMRVTEAWRRRGVAQALLDTATGFCRAQGYRRLILDTTEQQTEAHRLYERNGFTFLGHRMLGVFRVRDYVKDLG